MPNVLTLENNTLHVGKTAFFLCDMQEKFRPAIDHFKEIVEVSRRMVLVSNILNVPLLVTEQVIKICYNDFCVVNTHLKSHGNISGSDLFFYASYLWAFFLLKHSNEVTNFYIVHKKF